MNAINIFKISVDNSISETNSNIIDKKQLQPELGKTMKQRSIATAFRANMSKEQKKRKAQTLSNLFEKKLIIVDNDAWPRDHNATYGAEIIPNVCKEKCLDDIKMKSELRDFKLFGKLAMNF